MQVLWPCWTSAPVREEKRHFAQMFTQSKQSWSGAISGLLAIYRLFYKRLMQRYCVDVQALEGWREVHDPERTLQIQLINQLLIHYNQMRCTQHRKKLTKAIDQILRNGQNGTANLP